ncbi:MAG: hypothetical protein ACPGQL_01635 [Thermoplasmatota archaeon]
MQGGQDEDPLYGHTHLCAYEDLNQFGKALTSGYHGSIHLAIGGDMLDRPLRDPLFWASHRWLMDVQDSWGEHCTPAALSSGADLEDASTPGTGAALSLAMLACVAAARRRQRRA